MPPVTLEGDTLGEKHRHFNKLVEDAVADDNYELRNISSNDSDIENLLKIDIASKNRNLDYIIDVMKCNDMLYAATAIKMSTWLITEPQYAHIINPEYLHTQLLPSMNTKTFNKLMLHIRLNLKDESRVEAFYEYLKEKERSHKWLENCSILFIEHVIKNERHVPLSLFKRLCRRSAHFLEYHSRVECRSIKELKTEILFLIKSHPVDVLTVLEDNEFDNFPELGKKKTKILMKICPQKVLDNFDKYVNKVDLSVLVKYFNKNEIKSFVHKQAIKFGRQLYDYNTIKHFITKMPEQERFEFVKKTFIENTEIIFLFPEEERRIIESKIKPYQWYEFAPFNVVFPELKNLILCEDSPSERFAMFSVLITCARRAHIKTLLDFFFERHMDETLKFKIQFVNNLLSQISIHEVDVETWNLLDHLFHIMEVYTGSENDVQMCLESILLYKVLQDELVPEIVKQKLSFNTFHKVQSKLNPEQNSKMFTYLLNSILTKVQLKTIANDCDFSEIIDQLKNALTLLKDWRKDISNYPSVLQKIQELIKIKQEKMWKTDMSCLYNVKKSWRKHMFEESLSLCLSEEACLNALKHKPQLLTRHDEQIDTLRTNDAVSLRRLLTKLRVYWPDSLAQHFTDAYLQHLNKPSGQKAIVKGLFMLLSQEKVIDIAKKYVPVDYKINSRETGKADIRIRKNIAQNLHVARPLIPLDTILWYAKGDYLQYAVPSLISVLSKLSETESSRNYSVRKLGLRLGFSKLKPGEHISLILNIWNSTTNTIIKTVIFRHACHQMCRVKNETVEKELWKLISMFFEQLSPRDSKEIIDCLGTGLEKVPISVRTEFYMKSYEFLTTLPDIVKTDAIKVRVFNLLCYARWSPDLVESLDDDFVVNKLLSPAGTKFHDEEFIDIFSCYVLWGKSEEDQLRRFRKLVLPVMEEAFISWRKGDVDYYNEINNVKQFIKYLIEKYKDFTLSRRTTPAKLFIEIKTEMEKKMQLLENYALYTSWKLATEYAILMEQNILKMGDAWLSNKKNKIWKEIHDAMFPELGSIIVKCLKEDTEKYFPSICLLFMDAFDDFSYIYHIEYDFTLNILQNMLNDQDFAPSYILVSRVTADLFQYINTDPLKRIQAEILKKIKSCPSQEVQIHYLNDFKDLLTDE